VIEIETKTGRATKVARPFLFYKKYGTICIQTGPEMDPRTTPQTNTMKSHLLAIAATLLLGLFAPAKGAIVFDLNFPDVTNHTGTNWDDPTYGPAVRQELANVLNNFGLLFKSNSHINLKVISTMSGSYYAASGTSSFQMDPSGRFYDTAMYLKITKGIDINGSSEEAQLFYSFNYSALNYPDINRDGSVNGADFNLNICGLTRHEILHQFGVSSFIWNGASSSDRFGRYDTFLYDHTGTPYLNPNGSLKLGMNMNDPDAYFLSLDGHPYEVASPGDLSHLNDIMYPYRRDMNDDDRRVLDTLGYQLMPNPEPTSVLLIAAGAGILLGRRQRKR